jgi:hypothetical protein
MASMEITPSFFYLGRDYLAFLLAYLRDVILDYFDSMDLSQGVLSSGV